MPPLLDIKNLNVLMFNDGNTEMKFFYWHFIIYFVSATKGA